VKGEILQSRFVDLDGPVHFVDFGGEGPSDAGPTMVLVHGLGGSHLNWLEAGPGLATGGRRVLALDLAGFGRTPRAGRSARVRANQRLLGRFLDQVVGGPAILVGNSMGGMIALLEAADHPWRVAALVLVDPAMPRGRGIRLDLEGVRVLAAELRSGGRERTALALPDAAFVQAIRSMVTTLMWPRRYLALIGGVDVPTLVVHGAADRLVPLAAIQAVISTRPEWTLQVMEGVGHVPQLEAPDRFVEVVTTWLDVQRDHPSRQAG
jgi:pimeloyl-ACP methyl ester carboxylesterase